MKRDSKAPTTIVRVFVNGQVVEVVIPGGVVALKGQGK